MIGAATTHHARSNSIRSVGAERLCDHIASTISHNTDSSVSF